MKKMIKTKNVHTIYVCEKPLIASGINRVWLYAYVKVRISPVSICPIFT